MSKMSEFWCREFERIEYGVEIYKIVYPAGHFLIYYSLLLQDVSFSHKAYICGDGIQHALYCE